VKFTVVSAQIFAILSWTRLYIDVTSVGMNLFSQKLLGASKWLDMVAPTQSSVPDRHTDRERAQVLVSPTSHRP
jgi:hypothetical protein